MTAAVHMLAPDAEVRAAMRGLGLKARAAARVLANAPAEQKNSSRWRAPRACCASACPTSSPPTRAI